MSKKEKFIRVIAYGFFYWFFVLIFYVLLAVYKIHLFNYEIILYSFCSLVLLALIIDYFKRVEKRYMYEGFFVGVVWFFTILILSIPCIILANIFSKSQGLSLDASEIKRIFIHFSSLLMSIIFSTGIGYLLDYKYK